MNFAEMVPRSSNSSKHGYKNIHSACTFLSELHMIKKYFSLCCNNYTPMITLAFKIVQAHNSLQPKPVAQILLVVYYRPHCRYITNCSIPGVLSWH